MFAKGGYNWILGTLLIAALALVCYLFIIHWIFLILTCIFIILDCFFLLFFRDPDRHIGPGIVSPADGTVMKITNSKSTTRLAIFMSPFNVHVNRSPLDARVRSTVHHAGGYLPAYQPESITNEHQSTVLVTRIGNVKLVQIAGMVAKRIVPYIKSGDILTKGQRIGIIQFGSRVDLELPKNRVKIKTKVGDSVHAGITTIAEII
jgi:phosphatidylserine decarboxylase